MPLLSSDRSLLDRFRSGNKEALSTVYCEYAPKLAAFLKNGFSYQSKGRMMRFNGYHQPFDLDNVLQETFVRAFGDRARLAYDGITPYQRYLTTIARNVVLSEFRKKREILSQLEDPAHDPAAAVTLDAADPGPRSNENAESALLKQELAQLYAQFIEGLTERDRIFFLSRFEQQQTQVDAGKVVDLSHMQSRTLETKLKKRLLKFLQTHGYFEQSRKK